MSTTFIDFKELKESVSMFQVMNYLGLKLTQKGEQFRGCCPVHAGGERSLVVTPSKSVFYCWATKSGGDQIQLAAHVRGSSVKEAAAWLQQQGTVPVPKGEKPAGTVQVPGNSTELQPLAYLEPGADALKGTGLSEETCRLFQAGYAPKGVLRGRLAIPVHDRAGKLVAYCGRSLKPEDQPTLKFHNFDPTQTVWNAHRISGSDLLVAKDPLQAMTEVQNGLPMDSVVSFLTEGVTPHQLEILAALMDENGIELAHF
jgi:DNA primase